jgi:hypothetical protein
MGERPKNEEDTLVIKPPEDTVVIPPSRLPTPPVPARRWRFPVSGDSYRREDRWLSAVLKGAFVFGLVAVEMIVVFTFAFLMWRLAHWS